MPAKVYGDEPSQIKSTGKSTSNPAGTPKFYRNLMDRVYGDVKTALNKNKGKPEEDKITSGDIIQTYNKTDHIEGENSNPAIATRSLVNYFFESHELKILEPKVKIWIIASRVHSRPIPI